MHLLLMLVLLASAAQAETRGAIDATIHGTNEPLTIELLLRDASDTWNEVDHRTLAAKERHVRFDELASGIYQLRVRGPHPMQQLGTKIAIGNGDVRRTTITVEPSMLDGRVLFGDTQLANGGVILRNDAFGWRAGITLNDDGTFRVPLWQRGAYAIEVRSPALTTPYLESIDIAGDAIRIAIPDGRVRGVVRYAKSGAAIGDAIVTLQTRIEGREENARLTTGSDGRFDFAGIKYGQQVLRVYPAQQLEPEAITFTLNGDAPLRELQVNVEAGRAFAIVVIDKEHDPVANAQVFAVTDAKLRSRTTTDIDGRATIALPEGEAATLFVVPEEGPFAMQRVARDAGKGRLQLHLPSSESSLLIRARLTNGASMPPFSLLMRFNGELVPVDVADELGVQLMTNESGEALLEGIPPGSYEFWPYRTATEAESITAAATAMLAPIEVAVRTGENKIGVTFAPKMATRR